MLGGLFAGGFLPSIDISISFWPAEDLRFLLFGPAASVARLCSADIRSTTFVPVGRGLWPTVAERALHDGNLSGIDNDEDLRNVFRVASRPTRPIATRLVVAHQDALEESSC